MITKNVNNTPYSNRGVVSAENLPSNVSKPQINSREKDIIIDWLEFTIKDKNIYQILTDLRIDLSDIKKINVGIFGYNTTWIYKEKIKFMFNSDEYEIWKDIKQHNDILELLYESDKPDDVIRMLASYEKHEIHKLKTLLDKGMGIHILLSGYACREIELLYSWKELLNYTLINSSKVSRIDIAIDVFNKKELNLSKIKSYLKKGALTCKAKKVLEITERLTETGITTGETITFGSRSSNTQVQFYNKLKERANADYIIDPEIDYWIRCEVRLKNDSAYNFIKNNAPGFESIPESIMKVLYNLIDFKKINKNNKQKARWKTATWWERFIKTNEKMQLSDKAIQTTIQRKKAWIDKSVVKTLASVLVANYDMDWESDINDLIITGINKINNMNLEQINNYRIEKGATLLTANDLIKIKERLKNYD